MCDIHSVFYFREPPPNSTNHLQPASISSNHLQTASATSNHTQPLSVNLNHLQPPPPPAPTTPSKPLPTSNQPQPTPTTPTQWLLKRNNQYFKMNWCTDRLQANKIRKMFFNKRMSTGISFKMIMWGNRDSQVNSIISFIPAQNIY